MYKPAPVEMTSAVDSLALFFFLSSAINRILMILNRYFSVPVYSAGTTKVRILGHSTCGKQRQDASAACSFPLFLPGPHCVFPSSLENFLSLVIILLFGSNQNESWNPSLLSTFIFRRYWPWVFLHGVAAGIWDRTSLHCGSLQEAPGSAHQVPVSPLSIWQPKMPHIFLQSPRLEWNSPKWDWLGMDSEWTANGLRMDSEWIANAPGANFCSLCVSHPLENLNMAHVLMET